MVYHGIVFVLMLGNKHLMDTYLIALRKTSSH